MGWWGSWWEDVLLGVMASLVGGGTVGVVGSWWEEGFWGWRAVGGRRDYGQIGWKKDCGCGGQLVGGGIIGWGAILYKFSLKISINENSVITSKPLLTKAVKTIHSANIANRAIIDTTSTISEVNSIT